MIVLTPETKTPPVERWEANGFLPRMPDSLEQLDLLLIRRFPVKLSDSIALRMSAGMYLSPRSRYLLNRRGRPSSFCP